MKGLIKAMSLVGLLFALCACSLNSKKEGEQSKTVLTTLVGRKVTIEYPEMKADVTYLNDSTLHWSTLTQEGEIAEGVEHISYKNLDNNKFFINWIEQDGVTVSQVVDADKGVVTAFMSFNDETSATGKRSALFMDGKLTFQN